MFDKKGMSELSKALEKWEKGELGSYLAKRKERAASFKTDAGVEIERLYTPGDLPDHDYIVDSGFPPNSAAREINFSPISVPDPARITPIVSKRESLALLTTSTGMSLYSRFSMNTPNALANENTI